jgi:hypothetical protein
MIACCFSKQVQRGATEIKEVLEIYCQASGQRINMDKSSVFFSRGCPESVREGIKNVLDVQKETLSEKYLGMPSDVGKSKNGAFKYLKDRVWKKVLGWILLEERKFSLKQWLRLFLPIRCPVLSYRGVCASTSILCFTNFGRGAKRAKGEPAGSPGNL